MGFRNFCSSTAGPTVFDPREPPLVKPDRPQGAPGTRQNFFVVGNEGDENDDRQQ